MPQPSTAKLKVLLLPAGVLLVGAAVHSGYCKFLTSKILQSFFSGHIEPLKKKKKGGGDFFCVGNTVLYKVNICSGIILFIYFF